MTLMTLIQRVGATVLSAFLALNVLAMDVYKKRRVSPDPRSALNHGIAERFDPVEELRVFHAQAQAAVVALGEAATWRDFQAAVQRLAADPAQHRGDGADAVMRSSWWMAPDCQ